MTAPDRSVAGYGRLAEVYDRVYSWKDYAKESRIVRGIVRRWGPAEARTLLDVGCGTGAHLRHLREEFDCTGLDASRGMLAIARRRVPGVRWAVGSMPDFDLGRRFDVIACLFSAIGYVRSEAALRRTLATFARHLRPGGIAIVEPWLTPEAWRPGSVHLLVVPSPDRPIARMNRSRTVRGRSAMEMHYLVAEAGRVRAWTERHELSLFSTPTMREAFRSAGLSVRRIRSGFYARRSSDRGLFVGRLPP